MKKFTVKIMLKNGLQHRRSTGELVSDYTKKITAKNKTAAKAKAATLCNSRQDVILSA